MKNYMKKAAGVAPKKVQAPEHEMKPLPGSPAEEAGETKAFEAKELAMPKQMPGPKGKGR